MNKKLVIMLGVLLLMLSGCTPSSLELPEQFTMETLQGDSFTKNEVPELLKEYNSSSQVDLAIQMFLKHFTITGYENGVISYSCIDTDRIWGCLDHNDLTTLGNEKIANENLLELICNKQNIPIHTKTAEVALENGKYESNYFIVQNLYEFLDVLLQENNSVIESLVHNYVIVNDESLPIMEVGKSYVLMHGGSKICITLEKVLVDQEALELLKTKNVLNSFEVEDDCTPVYLQYSLVNLGQNPIESPNNFFGLDTTYRLCDLQQQPQGLTFPSTCNPLEITEYEKVLLLEDNTMNVYWINEDKIHYLIKIGGNDEK